MSWFWLPFALAALIALFGLLGIVLWTHEIILKFGLLREQRLWKDQTSLLVLLGLSGSCFTFFSFYVYPLFLPFFGSKLLQDARAWIIVWYILIALLLTLPLWAMSLYLRLRAQHRIEHCYFLPEDADLVRLRQCILGMQIAVMSLPKVFFDDLLDPFIRAIQVSSRIEAFPAGKQGKVVFTNNFSVYCDLAVQASAQGYYHLLEIYTNKRGLYEELAPLLKMYPDVDDAIKNRLHRIAKQITDDTDIQDGEQES